MLAVHRNTNSLSFHTWLYDLKTQGRRQVGYHDYNETAGDRNQSAATNENINTRILSDTVSISLIFRHVGFLNHHNRLNQVSLQILSILGAFSELKSQEYEVRFFLHGEVTEITNKMR